MRYVGTMVRMRRGVCSGAEEDASGGGLDAPGRGVRAMRCGCPPRQGCGYVGSTAHTCEGWVCVWSDGEMERGIERAS